MGRYDKDVVGMVRLCSVCGEPLPAGVQLHVPQCRDYHKAQLDAQLVERRKIRRETGK